MNDASCRNVLSVGLDPTLIHASQSSDSPPVLDHDTVLAAAHLTYERLRAHGFAVVRCVVDRGEAAETTYRIALANNVFDFVIIGAGIRLDPSLTELFEMLVNVGIELAPRAKLVFDTGPGTKDDAVLRWIAR